MYTIIPTEQFENDVKYYVTKKKFFHIGEDIKSVTDRLANGELVGDEIPKLRLELEGHTYKVRVANTDTKAGKSNGYRIIYYAIREDETIYLLTIYYKKEDRKIPTDKEIAQLVLDNCL